MTDERVLLVDDEEDFVEALSARMEARGLSVDVANSGAEALDKAKKKKYDAVIMDLAMPGMDGIEALRELRNHRPDIQVILLTGHGTLQKSVEAMKLGAMDFLEKPTEINVLLDKIRQAKDKSTEAEENRTQQLINDIVKTKGW